MKIIFLGTGTSQGVPVVSCKCKVCKSEDAKDKRLRSSAIVEIEGKRILIDAGMDFRQQLLRENIDSLDGIILTHEHKDHIGGLDDVRALNYTTGKSIDVYGEQRVLEAVQHDFFYAFSEFKYPGVPEINLHPISEGVNFELAGIKITPIRVMHHKLPIFGYRIGDLAYITDANFIAEAELEKVKGCSVLVLNALRHEEHISHFTIEQAIEISRQVGAKKTYFTHLSHQLDFHIEESKKLPQNIYLAYDGLQVVV